MAKIVIIGAGSHVFSRHLITDILTWPELRDGTISLMDISQEPLDLIAGFARRLVKQNGFETKIEATPAAARHWTAPIMFSSRFRSAVRKPPGRTANYPGNTG